MTVHALSGGVLIGDALYVYVRGRFILKSWLREGTTALFQIAPAFAYRFPETDGAPLRVTTATEGK